jgi:hypothetical protein
VYLIGSAYEVAANEKTTTIAVRKRGNLPRELRRESKESKDSSLSALRVR